MKHNDEEREQWVDNDEGLYRLMQQSALSKRVFVRSNRPKIDEVIDNVRGGVKPAHYLAYPTGDAHDD